ncbi:hypothetical protein DASC09_023620 [Saccharomycopsis crataegensis]|uniref:Uncharacterized protein n=1 Tax=Saccharomycopsis crataegensis TaxID=43959 RepID=A0AAV5QJR2_9ASCO|nr:hypothetical protein DASC09_023620 [Saccharomycopsis crataegensis]
MADDTYYLTPHESALAVVATSMKKSRLRLDTLIINSIIGGMLFSSGGMLHVVAQTNPELLESNPGLVHLLQGLVYPIGLFYVVIMGAELFNSNVLFFTVGLLRGAVGILDLLINWFLSWLFNLGANLFVCYVICYLSGSFSIGPMKTASIEIVVEKAERSFAETFIKGIACNFYVSLAIYLQIMCKPLHIKFLMMLLPVVTFVSIGYSHTVADMFLCPMGLMNGAPVKVGVYVWKILIPESLGNIVGGSFFGLAIPFYQHLVVVERDIADVGLPKYDARDEQPELMMDSRVTRTQKPDDDNHANDDGKINDEMVEKLISRIATRISEENKLSSRLDRTKSGSSSSISSEQSSGGDNVVQSYNADYPKKLSSRKLRSPPGVFPVKGMGEPLQREKTIATGVSFRSHNFNNSVNDAANFSDARSMISRLTSRRIMSNEPMDIEEELYEDEGGINAREEYLGNKLIKTLTSKTKTRKSGDEEDQIDNRSTRSARFPATFSESESPPTKMKSKLSHLRGHNHITSSVKGAPRRKSEDKFVEDLVKQNISNKVLGAANDVVGDDVEMNDLIKWSNETKRKNAENAEDAEDAEQIPEPSVAHHRSR